MSPIHGVSVVIPTYGREEVLVRTLTLVLAQSPPAAEVLVIDQTPDHQPATLEALRQWNDGGRIRWVVLDRPSIPVAMNIGLRMASSETVLFLDDDIEPAPGLIGAHAEAYGEPSVGAVVGQVLQPGEEPIAVAERRTGKTGLEQDLDFRFCRTAPAEDVANVMAGNLSVRRGAALEAGAFDERFLGQAYRFETEFARRLRRSGWRIRYEPSASLRHLRAPSGGVRRHGSDLVSASPDASVGDYYFALVEGEGIGRWRYLLRRPVRSVRTRFHLRRPWWIPVKLLGEVRGFAKAVRLYRERRAEKSRTRAMGSRLPEGGR